MNSSSGDDALTSPTNADLTALSQLSGDELLTLASDTAAAIRRLEGVLTAVSNEVAIRSDRARGSAGLAARHGYARASQLLERVTGFGSRTTSRLVRVGAMVAQRESETGTPLPPLYPLVGQTLGLGLIGVETADAITHELQAAAPRAEVKHLIAAEVALVAQATGASKESAVPLSADLIAEQAKLWKNALDQNGIEPRTAAAFAERDMWIGTSQNGLVPFGGRLTVDVAAKLNALFAAIISPRTAPRFFAEQEEAERDLPKDLRTPGQQRVDAFAAMIDSLARSADVPTVSGEEPTVIVSVTSEVLTAREGTGKLVGMNDPVAYSTIKQIMCDAGIRPVVLDTKGEIVALGNKLRTFTRAQREAMIARDGPTCGWGDCSIPASGCEGHHVRAYADGGPTDVINGVLLCWFHHRLIELGEWVIEMLEGVPVFSSPEWMARKPYLV
ncbi:hypothetical protein IWX78_000013 [Mycetocola sp. CAN_C7]|uniref:HNH endonuclease signature motif containing protein n=1 Tax=Mycetocola sp. CAN_C7 TaxID=2787724 RepID=UPI0018CB6FA0